MPEQLKPIATIPVTDIKLIEAFAALKKLDGAASARQCGAVDLSSGAKVPVRARWCDFPYLDLCECARGRGV